MTLDTDRARRHTARSVLRRIDDETVDALAAAARDPDQAAQRLEKLEREWDVDRTIETEAAAVGLTGLVLGAFVNSRFLAVPGVVGAAVFLFATTGVYPLLPLFRRLGLRTSREIQRERYALKALRGDFGGMHGSEPPAGGAQAPLTH